VTVQIREATPKDAESIASIHVLSWRWAYRGQLSDEYLDSLRVEDRVLQHRHSLEGQRPDWRTWVIEDEDSVAGFVVTGSSEDADADAKTGEVYAIYLQPERVGTGLGGRLFEHAVDDLRQRGFASATLWVLETNERARRFYELAGWKTDGSTAAERVDSDMRSTVRYRIEL
jgi:ribosomal protein S18 acetylase RimI-like enzyme